eukprot:jgi/Mesen1/6555/ME000334S05900
MAAGQTRERVVLNSSANFQTFSGLSSNNGSSLGGQTSTSHRLGHVSARTSVSQKKSGASSVICMAAGGENLPSLNDLPLITYINQQGRIVPPIEPKTEASVFAVYDANKKIQYIGFSKDVRNSLRTLMGRRPQFCYFYKIYNLTTMDQQQMLTIRSQWFSELGLPPTGNVDPIQKAYWEKPVDAGSISERGKAAAALSQAKTLLQIFTDRGLKEEMVYDPALIEQGKCDILASEGLSDEARQKAAEEDALSANQRRKVSLSAPDGEVVDFEINIQAKIVTNGGWMFDVLVAKDDKETSEGATSIDRVTAGLYACVSVLHYKKIPRQTEGVLAIDQFASNYFAVSEVAQKYDDFQTWFPASLPDSYWRFNRIHSYGNVESPAGSGSADAPVTLNAQGTSNKYT